MATTSSLGIGTGVDLQNMLTSILSAERAPIKALDTKIAAANSKISIYGTLKSRLDALQTAADTLQFPSRLSAVTASSSDNSIVTASANYTASVGSHTIETTQLASAQKSFTSAYSAGTTFGPGTLNFTVGGVAASGITLSNASNSLQDVSAAINSAKIGVQATVVTTSNGSQRMVITGAKSGAGNGFSVTASTLTPSGSQASLATFDATTTGLNRAVAQNALMKIDGIDVSSSNNTFSNISGLTLVAVKVGSSNVMVQNDSTKIKDAAEAFVSAYNGVVSLIKTNTGYDSATKTGKAFTGDGAARSVLAKLGSVRTTVPSELGSETFKTLSSLGITVQQSGLLSLDSSALNTAIGTSSAAVIKSLNAYGKSFSDEVTNMISGSGAVSTRTSALDDSVRRYKETQEKLEVRVSLVEKRYRSQFTALDKLVSSMQTTSSYLTQQLASLTA